MLRYLLRRIRLFKKKQEEPYPYLYNLTGFYPDNITYYKEALIHRSYKMEDGSGTVINNERLEFLGDALLSAIVADYLYHEFPDQHEGFLTSTRAKIVQRDTMNKCAHKIGLEEHLLHTNINMLVHNNCMFGNALEALIAAIYLDKGYGACQHFVADTLLKKYIDVKKLVNVTVNNKSYLLEWCQKYQVHLEFILLKSERDPKGSMLFNVAVMIADQQFPPSQGYSKKEAEQTAAKQVVDYLQADQKNEEQIKQRQQLLNQRTHKGKAKRQPDSTNVSPDNNAVPPVTDATATNSNLTKDNDQPERLI